MSYNDVYDRNHPESERSFAKKMNIPHRFISELSGDEIATLNEMVKNHNSYHIRRRAHAVLLSYEQFGIAEIARACKVSRNSVSSWLKAWETEGIGGLYVFRAAALLPN